MSEASIQVKKAEASSNNGYEALRQRVRHFIRTFHYKNK